jgi:hypothetical protein
MDAAVDESADTLVEIAVDNDDVLVLRRDTATISVDPSVAVTLRTEFMEVTTSDATEVMYELTAVALDPKFA